MVGIISEWGSRDVAVVKAPGSHQCDPARVRFPDLASYVGRVCC